MDGDPPETSTTAARLRSLGHARHEVLHMLSSVVAVELWEMTSSPERSDRRDIVDALDALPESWEQLRRR